MVAQQLKRELIPFFPIFLPLSFNLSLHLKITFCLKKTVDGCWRRSSTYLSIIGIEDKKKDKTYKFRNNDILNHNIFSSMILVIKHFFPFISDCLLQVLKILCQFWFVRIW